MDYEKKYKEALARAKSMYESSDEAELAAYIFPELRESEDERIRKAIVETIKQCPDTFLNPKNRDDMVSYLEKQKEQKPELVQQPPITYTYNSNASRDERLKAALLALLNSDLLKVKEGGYFTKQDLIEWVERTPTDKPAEWSEEDEKKRKSIINILGQNTDAHEEGWSIFADEIAWLKSLRPQLKRDGGDDYIKGYNKGYKDAEEAYNKSVAYHFPIMPTPPSGWGCDGTHCTNPHMDCINCPRKTTGGMFTTPNTASGTSTATLQGNTSVTDGKEHNPSFTE